MVGRLVKKQTSKYLCKINKHTYLWELSAIWSTSILMSDSHVSQVTRLTRTVSKELEQEALTLGTEVTSY